MKRQQYKVWMTFRYANGEDGGILSTTVNSKAAAVAQVEANRRWLAAKGHTLLVEEITPL